ncbi:U-box domain-containing protein 15 [Rutidosis leptorrhynchoides]|uniref:U-box domain-containing protein 15 n=1 Tax=Rutidosis leptorrhynchoides TaxID=125765 RepID=UPI003A99F622
MAVNEGKGKMENLRNAEGDDLVAEMMNMIDTVTSYTCFRRTQRKECLKLVRRLKLLFPLFEETKEMNQSIPTTTAFYSFLTLKKALFSAKKLLKQCNFGSKIFLALESDAIMSRFHCVYNKLNEALDGLMYQQLGISEEVQEQIELLQKQLQGAKQRTDTLDVELAMDMMIIFSKYDERHADIVILERLAKKLDLYSTADLEIETVAVKKLVKERGTTKHVESTQQIVDLLKKFKQVAGFDDNNNGNMNKVVVKDDSPSLERCRSMLIPHEFLCPISLEIMTDPVIIATGQTYERENILKWLNSNHTTCPKTGETLTHLAVAPNFALRNLILQWCEKNKFELPEKEIYSLSSETTTRNAFIDEVYLLVQDISSSQLSTQSQAVEKIRMLSKENPENRILIANCGAIPPLVELLYSHNWKVKQHSVTALLNLSLDESNKRLIAREGAIPAVIEVLQNGTDEARENSAATLFSLSMLNENKVMIGCLKGIPPLVKLLKDGSVRGKKDAATALFNLSLNQSNKSRAIKAGIIEPLLHLLKDKSMGMVDEALSILSLVAKQAELGQTGFGQLAVIETLVGFVKDGTPKNKECATAVLVELGLNNSCLILAALQYGVYDHLVELTKSGTTRAQRKATALLQLMSKCEHIP